MLRSHKSIILLAIASALILNLSGCSELDEVGHALFGNPDEPYQVKGNPDTNLSCVILTTYDAEYDKDADSVTRAYAELYIACYHEKPFGCTYTIDGQPGTGALSLHRLDVGDNGASVKTETFQGNFPSGTPLDLPCYRVANRSHQYHGKARFLLPMLEPGIHTLMITVTNELGQTGSDTQTFTVKENK